MIREGKLQGWLHLPVEALSPWAALTGAQLHSVRVGLSPIDKARGAGVYATEDVQKPSDASTTLMTVPRDLILSKERVQGHALADKDLRVVLETLGEFANTPRISILAFLLTQSCILNPSLGEKHFVHSPFTTYVRLPPLCPLPTFWAEASHRLLQGTTLLPALTAKLASLYREFDTFRTCTSRIEWCQRLWWDEIDGILAFDDWLQVDAMYRSRALEFPGIGDCMAPVIDMANHASGDATSAIYEVNGDGDAVLLLRQGKEIKAGEEVTITYGDAKGACEMLFSYGFIEDGHETARELFLDLSIPDDDPLAKAKMLTAAAPPGFKVADDDDYHVRWEGDFIWMICVNEEDGLEFMIERTVDGQEDLKAVWQGEVISSASDLKTKLQTDDMWDVFQLRAISILQSRVSAQLDELMSSDQDFERLCDDPEAGLDHQTKVSASTLRTLERNLLALTNNHLSDEINSLSQSEVVTKYIASMNGEPEDFS